MQSSFYHVLILYSVFGSHQPSSACDSSSSAVFCRCLLFGFLCFSRRLPVTFTHSHGAFVARLVLFCSMCPPTCFVEGISVGVARRLLGRFCRVHIGIRFNTILRQRKTEIKRPENPRVFIPHMFLSVSLCLPPSPLLAGFLSFCRPLGLFGVSGLASFLSIVPGPTSLSLCPPGSLSLPPSSPYLPSLSASLSASLSIQSIALY